MQYFRKVRSFLLEPSSSFRKESKSSLTDAFMFIAIIGAISAVLGGFLSGLTGVDPFLTTFASTTALLYLAVLLGIPLSGLWIHLWAFIFGAREGIDKTLKVTFYSSTPSFLVIWLAIPITSLGINGMIAGSVLAFAGAIWTLILEVKGLRILQKMPQGRAVAAILIPIVIIALFAIAILVTAFMFASIYYGGEDLQKIFGS